MKILGNEIKPGMILEHKNDLWEVLKTQHVKPGKGGAFNQVEMKSVNKNTKLNERFRSSDTVEKASLEEIKFTYLYKDELNYYFMNAKNFEQIGIKKEKIGQKGNFLSENLEVMISFYNEDHGDRDGKSLIDLMVKSYFDSGFELKSVLRCLFNSDHFKSSKIRYAKVKSPIELIVGILKLAEEFKFPNMNIIDASRSVGYMGQQIYNPPSVEGWHEGVEWLDSGNLLERKLMAP